MRRPSTGLASRRLALLGIVFALLLSSRAVTSQQENSRSRQVVLSDKMEKGILVYRLDGTRVEDTAKNSLLKNLGELFESRGAATSVVIVIDVRAPFSEAGKLETALDMVGLTHYRLFVSNFRDGLMNEIHWDERSVPIPAPDRR